MRKRWRAFRSLRLNYSRKGVYVWLKGTHKRQSGKRGWQLILTKPEEIEEFQHALAGAWKKFDQIKQEKRDKKE